MMKHLWNRWRKLQDRKQVLLGTREALSRAQRPKCDVLDTQQFGNLSTGKPWLGYQLFSQNGIFIEDRRFSLYRQFSPELKKKKCS